MANFRIPDLTAGITLSGSEQLEMWQAGPFRTTVSDVATYAASALLGTFVPFSGSASNLDMNNKNITGVRSLTLGPSGSTVIPLIFSPSATAPSTTVTGDVYWHNNSGLTVVAKNASSDGLTVTNGAQSVFMTPLASGNYIGGTGADLILWAGSAVGRISSAAGHYISFNSVGSPAYSAQFSINSGGNPNTFAIRDSSDANTIFNIDVAGVITSSNLAGSGTRMVVASSGGILSTQSVPSGGSIAGSTTQIQYNNSGVFGASANLAFASNIFLLGAPTAPTGGLSNFRIKNGGTGLLDFGDYSGARGAIWVNASTPSSSNWALSADASSNTYLNTPSAGTGNLLVGGSIIHQWDSAAMYTPALRQFSSAGLTIGSVLSGTAKLNFFGSLAPIAQPGATTDLGLILSNLGLRVAGAAYPITTSGAVSFSGTMKFGGTASSTTGYVPTATDADGNWTWQAAPGGSPALTATYIGVGNGSNLLSGTSDFIFSGGALTLNSGSGGVSIKLSGATNFSMVEQAGNDYYVSVNSASGNCVFRPGNSTEVVRFTPTAVKIASGMDLILGNAATTGLTAGVLAALTNATIVIKDSTGQTYRIPCII